MDFTLITKIEKPLINKIECIKQRFNIYYGIMELIKQRFNIYYILNFVISGGNLC